MEVKNPADMGLYAVGKGQKHKNPKIAFCKLKVQIASCSEKPYNLVREKLKTEKKYSCDNGTGSYGITISFSDPVIFSRTIVKSPDRLAAL